MKIKDYNDAMEFFRTNDYQAADGAWSEFYQSEVLEPRIMDQASLADDLEPGALRDEMLKGFDPSQETYEEYLQRISLERPFNAAHGGRIGFRKGLGLGKGRPGVKKDYKTSMEQLYTPEVQKKRIQTVKNIYQSKPVGKRVQWIADNGKNYDTPKDFIKAYEKHFGHKLGSKTDALFYFLKIFLI